MKNQQGKISMCSLFFHRIFIRRKMHMTHKRMYPMTWHMNHNVLYSCLSCTLVKELLKREQRRYSNEDYL